MRWRSFGFLIAFIGAAFLACGAGPVPAALASQAPSAVPSSSEAPCTNADPSIHHLATLENRRDARFQCLGLVLEGDTIKAIRVETHSWVSTRGRSDTERVEVAEFPAAVLESGHGAVLDGVPGHDAIILQGHLSSSPGQAALVTTFLYNGFTSEYRSCQIRLARAPESGWRLIDRFEHTVSHIVVMTREMPLIGMFGIATLEGACS